MYIYRERDVYNPSSSRMLTCARPQPRTLLSEHVREHEIANVSTNSAARVEAWLEGGLASFAAFWGFSPIVVSMPHHACLASAADALFDRGFVAFDNTHIQVVRCGVWGVGCGV